MLTKKLRAAVGIAGALLLGVAGSAEARPGFGGGLHRGPVFHGVGRARLRPQGGRVFLCPSLNQLTGRLWERLRLASRGPIAKRDLRRQV